MIVRKILLLIFLSAGAAKAQDTLRYRLREVPVSATRFEVSGTERLTDTSKVNLITARTSGELLSREPGVFIRNYGPGNISTLSLRGLSPVHTPVFWYGLPVNSPMLGLSDLSILPTFLTGGMNIHYGGIAPLNGSGAVSGSIHLGDPVRENRGYHIGLLASGGSFGEQQAGLELDMNQGGFSNRTRLYSSGCTNDFPYTSPDGLRLNQVHATMRQMGFTHDFSLESKNNRIESHVWYLESERDIPPHMLGGSNSQEQVDGSMRWITSWHHTGLRSSIRVLGGMSRERLRFTDASVLLDDRSRSMNAIAGLEGGYRLRPGLRLEGQFGIQHATALSDGYTGTAEQQQWNFTGKAISEKKNLNLMLAVRYGFAGGRSIPLLPAFTSRWRLNRLLSIHAEVSRVYRIPTLNDLFWEVGGQPELRPESGWSTSTGFQLQGESDQISWSVRSSVFLISLNDAITWLPDDQAIYRATNMHTLVSKGIESTSSVSWTSSTWKVSAAWSPTIVSSVTRTSEVDFAQPSDRQLPYTPRLSHKGLMEVEHRGFGIRYIFQYTGHRYTTVDHAHYLTPYGVSDLFFSWHNRGKRSPLTLTFAVKNMFNREYQVMAWRAMPGRSFQMGMMISLQETTR